ncbi:MAG: hypothetical protein V1843_02975, partial [bacterium]
MRKKSLFSIIFFLGICLSFTASAYAQTLYGTVRDNANGVIAAGNLTFVSYAKADGDNYIITERMGGYTPDSWSVNSSNFLDENPTNGDPFVVEFCYQAGNQNGSDSSTITFAGSQNMDLTTLANTGKPASPTITAILPSANQMQLQWANVGGLTYRVYRYVADTGYYQRITTGVTSPYNDFTIVPGQVYYYIIIAEDGVGNRSGHSNIVTEVGTGDAIAPADVTGLTATKVVTGGQINLAWTNPGDVDFAGVIIRRKTGGYPISVSDGNLAYNGSAESYSDTGLTNGTTYYYKAYTYDEVPNYSTGVTTYETPGDTSAPGLVTGFSITVEA